MLALLPAAVFATSVLQAAEGTRIVNIVLQVNKVTSKAAIDSCSLQLTSGGFEKTPIAFGFNEHGAGNLTVGEKIYIVHEIPEFSGGIVCSSIVSPYETLLNCETPVASSLKLSSPSRRNLKDCFPEGPLELASVMDKLESTPKGQPLSSPEALSSIEVRQTNTTADHVSHGKRQGSCGFWSSYTAEVGDGNPHQNPLNVQVSQPMGCQQGTCSVGYSMITSFTIGWSAGASAAGWISGGFAVEQSVETGQQYSCEFGPGSYFAVWKKVGQTAYTVQNWDLNQCTGAHKSGGPFVMWSPNSHNKGMWFYCVSGRQYVRWLGDRWLDTDPGMPGGPWVWG
ncbi:hypothetical protein C8A05DRAFT_41308 [Staphylotrichum tortipilum]|uniref:Uncharacterized protein n=1 Tax=Staphylotrichum tortipilum TaxID=2831512 RepID=A0AAN6RW99_9PEZI|nr:hypothetical protein C8A05DRAFT_41308 [Staphylotrichum longicolle]